MGAPASCAIVRAGKTTLYYDHGGAYGFVPQVFFGPSVTEEFFRSGREVDWLYRDGWAEAGAVLDFDVRRFAFFADDFCNTYHAEFRDYFLPVMQANWPGWDLSWATGEMVELAELIGHDPESVRGEPVEATNPGLGLPPELAEPNESFTNTCFSSVVSIRKDGQIRDLEFEDDASHLLAMGLGFPAATRNWSTVAHGSARRWEDTLEGFFLDHDTQRVAVWERSGSYLERCRDVFRARWPGWRFNFHHDGLPGQWIRTGRDPAQVLFGEEKILDRLLEHLAASCAIAPQVVFDHLERSRDDSGQVQANGSIDTNDRAAILARSIAEYRRTRGTSPNGI